MIDLSIHDAAGRFLHSRSISLSDGPYALADEGTGAVEGKWSAATHYALAGAAVDRPTLSPIALAVDEEWTPEVPAGTPVVVDGVNFGTLDADEPIKFNAPGVYSVELFPWRPVVVTVT